MKTLQLCKEIIINQQSPVCKQITKKISVIIPTFQGKDELAACISSLRKQEGISSFEILVSDSGSTDGTPAVARKLGASVLPPEGKPFNHGRSRTYAASFARGDILVFLVQDAILNDVSALRNLLSPFETCSESVGAVTGKQVPGQDADLFARWQVEGFYRSLFLDNEALIQSLKPSQKYESCSLLARRRLSMLDNVFCAVRKNIFFACGGFPDIPISEDTYLATVLAKKNYAIGFCGNAQVFHSHTRSSEYFFRRYYIGVKTQLQLYGEHVKSPFRSVEELVTAYKMFISSIPEGTVDADELTHELALLQVTTDQAPVTKECLRYIASQLEITLKNVFEVIPRPKLRSAELKTLKTKILASMAGKHLAELTLAVPSTEVTIPVQFTERI